MVVSFGTAIRMDGKEGGLNLGLMVVPSGCRAWRV